MKALTKLPFLIRALAVTILVSGLSLAVARPAPAQQLLQRLHSASRETARDLVVRQHPRTGQDDCIEQLAREIDWLEAWLDQYGSVVAKHPDVWGESRLTKYRSEYELELSQRLSRFELRDNAAILRSDLAFLSQAMGVGAAIEARAPASVSMSASTSGESSQGGQPDSTAPAAPKSEDIPKPAISQKFEWNPASEGR